MEWFYPTQGLLQGNPISSIYFILLVEILGQNIRSNSQIRGIVVGEQEFKIGQFADDTTLFLDYSQDSIQAAINTLDEFQHNSGLKLNYDKSSVYRIRSLKNTMARLYTNATLQWTNNPVNILGVQISNDQSFNLFYNYESMAKRLRTILSSWEHRGLKLLGKVV